MPTQNDINSGVLRQRRNVLSTSFLLIIFEIAGGKIDSFSTILGTIKINEPMVIYWSILLYLLYSLWRYWIYVSPLTNNYYYGKNCPRDDTFRQEWQRYLGSDQKYKEIVWDVFNQKVKSIAEGYLIKKEDLAPLLIGNFFKRKIDFTYTLSYEGHGNCIKGEGAIVPVSYTKVFFVELKAQIKAIVKERCFSDYFIPYLIAFVAIVIVIIKRLIM